MTRIAARKEHDGNIAPHRAYPGDILSLSDPVTGGDVIWTNAGPTRRLFSDRSGRRMPWMGRGLCQLAGRLYRPHFLGGGIGLAASTEILAAVGGTGLLEVDINPNPLRSAFALAGIDRASGAWQLSPDPGHGGVSPGRSGPLCEPPDRNSRLTVVQGAFRRCHRRGRLPDEAV